MVWRWVQGGITDMLRLVFPWIPPAVCPFVGSLFLTLYGIMAVMLHMLHGHFVAMSQSMSKPLPLVP
jgi:hypothetical protein